MFKFSELKSIHLEVTNNCQASCPMCSRNINGGLDNPLLKVNSWSLDDFKTVMSVEVLQQIQSFYFCGNFGDPILNDDLIEMCKYTQDTAPQITVRIHTNGGARKTKWWADLARSLNPNHNVIFALDGLSDTHSIYRIGTNFETILRNAKAFIDAGGKAEWCFIKFKHNEHQVEQAQAMAQELGFHKFTLKNSSRFILEPRHPVMNKNGETIYFIEPSGDTKLTFIDRKVLDSYKTIMDNSKVECFAQNVKEIYIDAYKNVFPCCWLASTPYNYISDLDPASSIRFEINKQYYDLIRSLGDIDSVNAIKNTISDIIDNDSWQTVWDEYWTTKKLITCVRTCGVGSNFSKPKDQFIEVLNLNE